MRTRRGSDFWPGEMGGMVSLYRPGDIVQSLMAGKDLLTGVVRDVDSRINKIWVAWGGGSVVQHDPDEIQLVPAVDDTVRARLNGISMTASRRGKMSSGDQFVGDPDTHGINEPRGGGFSIMQDLQGDLAKEMKKESEAGPRVAKSEVDQHGIHKSWYKSIDDTEITVRQLREDIDDADNMSPKQRKILLDYLKEKRGKNASSDTVASMYDLRSRRTASDSGK